MDRIPEPHDLDTTVIEAIITMLDEVVSGNYENIDKQSGLCLNIDSVIFDKARGQVYSCMLAPLAAGWEYHSGCTAYYVPESKNHTPKAILDNVHITAVTLPEAKKTAMHFAAYAYSRGVDEKNQYDGDNVQPEYYELRHHLANYLSGKFTEILLERNHA